MNKVAVEELARLSEFLEGHGLAVYAEQVDDLLEKAVEMGLIRGAAIEYKLSKEADETPEQKAKRERLEFAQKGLGFLSDVAPAGEQAGQAGAGGPVTTTVQPSEIRQSEPWKLGPGYEREFLKTLNQQQVQNVLMKRIEQRWRANKTWLRTEPPGPDAMGAKTMDDLYNLAEREGIIPKG